MAPRFDEPIEAMTLGNMRELRPITRDLLLAVSPPGRDERRSLAE
jgi:hypothetical protein